MNVTRALGALLGLLMTFGMGATAAAESDTQSFDARTSRSTYLYLGEAQDTPRQRKQMGEQRRIRLRYERSLQVGGSDFVLRFKAPLKKKKLLAFELIF